MELYVQSTPRELKNGTINFFNDLDIEDQKIKMKNKGYNWDDSMLIPLYSITKSGKLYRKPGGRSLAFYSGPPLNSVENYLTILKTMYETQFLKRLEKWRSKYEKNSAVVSEMPAKYLKYINPKLVTAKNIGILDED
jgi:hypothetical protein